MLLRTIVWFYAVLLVASLILEQAPTMVVAP
jgi:hypothetical protein